MLKKYVERFFGKRASRDDKRHHVIISGTGRAGTTFLVSLLTKLGLDTGFRDPFSHVFPSCNGGMERDIRYDGSAYIVKGPLICDHLGEALQSGRIAIDHAFVPVRDLYSAAESRRFVVRNNAAIGLNDNKGGLWGTADGSKQETVLTEKLYKLIYEIAKHDISLTLLSFPRIVFDPDYLWGKLHPVFPSLKYRSFRMAFEEICQPELVHSFNDNRAVHDSLRSEPCLAER